jgi:PAS domain S-box-containing protein
MLMLKNPISIRRSLAMLVLACVAPWLVAGAGLIAYNFYQQRAVVVDQTQVNVRALMLTFDRELATVTTALTVLATFPSLSGDDLGVADRQAREVLHDGAFSSIELVDRYGQQLLNTSQPYGAILPKSNFTDQVARVLKTGQPEVSELRLAAMPRKPLISVAVPVGSPQGSRVLLGLVQPAHMQEILDTARLPEGRIGVLFDALNVIVARTQQPEKFVGLRVSPDLLKALSGSSDGWIQASTLEGISVYSIYTRSSVTGWGVAIGVPSRTLVAGVLRSAWLLVGVAAVLLVMSFCLAWFMGGRIASAITALRSTAQSLGVGRAVSVPRFGVKEVNEVGQAMLKASDALASTSLALTESEKRMRSILNSAMDAIVTVDDDHTIVLFNPAASRMYGCSVESALGCPLTRFIPERFYAEYFAYDGHNLEGEDGAGEVGKPKLAVGLRENGQEFSLEVSYSRVVESGIFLHTRIIRDITDRVQAFEALERSNMDLQQFAFVASHDLKTPLRSISGFVQMLEKNYADRLDDKALQLISRTAQAAKRLEQLTDDLLSYARISAESRPFTEIDMGEVAQEVISLLDAAIREYGAVVTVGDLPRVMGDRTQLVQLLLNLIGNGMKFCSGRTPAVHVSAACDAQQWVFAVADNGIGIDAKHHVRIFDVFKRLHTQNEYPGTGIGLTVCRRVVERHGGRI